MVYVCSSEIIDQLSFVHGMQIHDSFQFYDYSLLYQNVCPEFSDHDITIKHLYGMFRFRPQPTRLQFYGQRLLIY